MNLKEVMDWSAFIAHLLMIPVLIFLLVLIFRILQVISIFKKIGLDIREVTETVLKLKNKIAQGADSLSHDLEEIRSFITNVKNGIQAGIKTFLRKIFLLNR